MLCKSTGMVIDALRHEKFSQELRKFQPPLKIPTQGGMIMCNRLNLMAGVAALFAVVPGPSLAQSIDESFYYKLSTDFRGDGMKLDVFNGGPKNNRTRLEPDQDVSGQFWRLVANGDGTYRLSTLFRGQNMCLDIFNGGPNNNEPHLTRCGNYTGQFWKLNEEGGAIRLTTTFRGPRMCLDIFNGGPNNNQPHLARCGNYTGQLWTFTRTDKRVDNDWRSPGSASGGNSDASPAPSGAATAQEWPKQIELTERHIQAFLATNNEMAKLVSATDLKDLASNSPDPKVRAQAELVAKKNGFASLAEFGDVSENILVIFMGIDPLDPQKKFHQPAELIKQSISVLKTDNSVPEKEKKEHLAMLEEALQKAKPIRFKDNIPLVQKYYDKLPPLTTDEREKLCLAELLFCVWAAFPDGESVRL